MLATTHTTRLATTTTTSSHTTTSFSIWFRLRFGCESFQLYFFLLAHICSQGIDGYGYPILAIIIGSARFCVSRVQQQVSSSQQQAAAVEATNIAYTRALIYLGVLHVYTDTADTFNRTNTLSHARASRTTREYAKRVPHKFHTHRKCLAVALTSTACRLLACCFVRLHERCRGSVECGRVVAHAVATAADSALLCLCLSVCGGVAVDGWIETCFGVLY